MATCIIKERKELTGKYTKDQNFITVFPDSEPNTMYTIARNTGDWNFIKVGQSCAYGEITQSQFDKWKSECPESGTFVIFVEV